jgi:Orsellinic acid/F9775 biosynthesis cluster protein D
MSDHYLYYLPEFHVLVCRICQAAIPKGYVQRHFQKRHKDLELSLRLALNDHIKGLEIWDTQQVIVPYDGHIVIPDLKLYEGLGCLVPECNFHGTTVNSLKQHARESHEWVKSKGK